MCSMLCVCVCVAGWYSEELGMEEGKITGHTPLLRGRKGE